MMPVCEEYRYKILSCHCDLLARIEAAERYAVTLLPFIPRGLPVFQSHGISHSLAIIRYINQIIRTAGLKFRPQEIFLLYLAAWFHDIGYLHPCSLHNRKIHSNLSCEMIRKDPVIAGLVHEQEVLVLDTIIRYHNSHADLTTVQEYFPFRAPLLAALFRLADLADIGADRCPPEVFDLIQDGLSVNEVQHWQAYSNIIGCIIIYPFIMVLVRNPDNPHFNKRIIPHVKENVLSLWPILKQYGLAFPVPVYFTCDQKDSQIIPCNHGF